MNATIPPAKKMLEQDKSKHVSQYNLLTLKILPKLFPSLLDIMLFTIFYF